MKLLVIGAGPYGLAAAAAARTVGIEPIVVGEPMGFWRRNMPAGMLLRSPIDWHLDPAGHHTMAAFLEERGIAPAQVDPLPLELFLDYAAWFQARERIAVHNVRVRGLQCAGRFLEATFDDGRRVVADAVVATPGVEPFARLPEWVQRDLPPELYSHTSHVGQLDRLAGARVLIVGGRQSAYEWAALLAERGAERVEIVHRHALPRFAAVDWRFIERQVEATLAIPGWFRSLTKTNRERLLRGFWAQGRQKLEPWLERRVDRPEVGRRPHSFVVSAAKRGDGTIAVNLPGDVLHVDHVVLATGYEVDLRRVPYLSSVVDDIALEDGHPLLDENFQTSIPGLFLTGMVARRGFGPIFGHVRGAPVAAAMIASGLVCSWDVAGLGQSDRMAA
jgi:thioredoxin reductase